MKQTYPKGAVTSVEELAALAGKPVWAISPTHSRSVDSDKCTITGITSVQHNRDGSEYHFYQSVGCPSVNRSLLDMNIPLNSYNDWFLFANREDAVAYLGRDG